MDCIERAKVAMAKIEKNPKFDQNKSKQCFEPEITIQAQIRFQASPT